MGFALIFLALPLAELVVLAGVEARIGLGWTLGLIVLTGLAGALLVRRQGLAVWADARRSVAAGVFPGRQLAHGALLLVGGTLLLTPGFITDALGLTLMVPVIRELVRLRLQVFFRNRPAVR